MISSLAGAPTTEDGGPCCAVPIPADCCFTTTPSAIIVTADHIRYSMYVCVCTYIITCTSVPRGTLYVQLLYGFCPVSSAAVDERGYVAGTEAVVDVDYADVGGAGVHHSEQSRQAFEGCAITNAGGNGNHRDSYQAPDYAGESAFHAGADYDYAGFG